MPVRLSALAWRAVSLLPDGAPVGAAAVTGLAHWGLHWPPLAAVALGAALLGWDLLIRHASARAATAAAARAETEPAPDAAGELPDGETGTIRRLPAPHTSTHPDNHPNDHADDHADERNPDA